MDKKAWRAAIHEVVKCQTQLSNWTELNWIELFISLIYSWSEVKWLSRVWLFATPWTVAHQAPLSMGFSRQEYWSGLPLPSPGDLSDPGIKPRSPVLQAEALTSEPPGRLQSTLRTTHWVLNFKFFHFRLFICYFFIQSIICWRKSSYFHLFFPSSLIYLIHQS